MGIVGVPVGHCPILIVRTMGQWSEAGGCRRDYQERNVWTLLEDLTHLEDLNPTWSETATRDLLEITMKLKETILLQ